MVVYVLYPKRRNPDSIKLASLIVWAAPSLVKVGPKRSGPRPSLVMAAVDWGRLACPK
ncbi:hypothetical protein FMEAI12_5540035 [Parafrankia sp. Ea1.12]|nr:hypothetical protein FMEAI12_5540035 [Parafrankia sp. Ea1.12]